MQIIEKKLADIIPYENNPRKNADAIKYVANSIQEFGFKVPIIIDKENVIVAGHTRAMAAESLGMDTVPCVVADDLTEEQVRAFRLADNKVSEIAEWNLDALDEELEMLGGFDMSDFGFEELDHGFDEIIEDIQSKYTATVKVPQYEIKGELPDVTDLYDAGKAKELIEELENAQLPQEVKDFLTFAAYRHIQFNYKNIAEFYAHQEKEVQELMEKSALVIIDFEDAIAYGYAKLEQKILDQIEEDEDDE